MSNHLKGMLMAFFGVFILSPDAVLIRLADADSWSILLWRGIFYALGILIILLITHRSKALNEVKKIGKDGVLIGILTGLGSVTFVFAVQLTSIASALVIISIMPMMTAIISWLILKEKSGIFTWFSMVLVFIGIYIVMDGEPKGSSLIGNLFALASVTFGATGFTLIRKNKSINMIPAMGVNAIVSALIAAIFVETVILPLDSMLYIFVMGLMVSLSFSLLTSSGRYIPATEVGMFMPLGAVFGTLAGWLIINEQPSSGALIGGFIVLLTMFVHSWHSNKIAKD
ncbi:DMT family transporter [Candidatus Thioglobus sp. NP1]|uniref:DMT family transporter n=1 Tax=Candidatus Thioglobus sp. NP1 TaxID=2508687 RepID=UPI000DEDBEE3|nr:DMT family transporter [Candidatus Thioglobus sp. NP1]AXE61993.1 EamA family transporter [Candidatus Thioglobus sp. NP1]